MKLRGRHIAGGACVVVGATAYIWLMAAELVPTAVELGAAFGVGVASSVAWAGLTVGALAVVFFIDRVLSTSRR